MTKRLPGVSLVAAAMIAFTHMASAQEAVKLQEGMWTGSLIPPEGDTVAVRYEVKRVDNAVHITLRPSEDADADVDTSLPLSNIHMSGGKLFFTFDPGITVNCILEPQQGGGYAGPCSDDEGGNGSIIMVPPGKEAAVVNKPAATPEEADTTDEADTTGN